MAADLSLDVLHPVGVNTSLLSSAAAPRSPMPCASPRQDAVGPSAPIRNLSMPFVSTSFSTSAAVTAAPSRDGVVSLGVLPVRAEAVRPARGNAARATKAAFDVVMAVLLLVLLAPALLAIALMVRVTSTGPALFRQTRVGRDGHEFTMYKFRSMCVDAEDRLDEFGDVNDGNGVLFKLHSDPRITGIGRVLRRLSLDELPQLINVATGSMSLVGPRPPLPNEVAAYHPEAHRRLLVKPGITGLWQVSGRSNLSWEESIRLDLRYVEEWSLSLDLVVLWKTFRAVVRADGAY